MGKRAMNSDFEEQSRISQISESSSNEQRPRSPEREALAAAIEIRDASASQTASLVQARARAAQDRFAAARAVEAAESALTAARETLRAQLVDAYISGEDIDTHDIADAESALAKAQRRLADLSSIADGLAAHERQPGSSVPALNLVAAIRDVIKAAPITRRLVEDYRTAERTFQQYQATLIFLAGQHAIPDDLQAAAPKAHHTRFAEPDPAWVAAIAALAQDADVTLPE
jgi:hypothetical protein